MKNISVLIKPASGACNMTCDYCFYCDEAAKREQKFYGMMSEETLKNMIRRTMLHSEGSVSYTWQGGEPTLRGLDFFRKALYLQKKYNRNHLQVINAFQTNGYGITDDWCMFFKENKFLVGVSVDGLPEIHDSIRHNKIGDGTFEQINKNIKLLDKYGIDLAGKKVTIIGRSNIVGKPLIQCFLNKNATVTICHSKTDDIKEHTKDADIVVVAIGKPKFLKENMVKKNSVIIDVGINRDDNGKIIGDVDFENVSKKSSYITPVPGGVGPMTIAMLMNNVIKAAENV